VAETTLQINEILNFKLCLYIQNSVEMLSLQSDKFSVKLSTFACRVVGLAFQHLF